MFLQQRQRNPLVRRKVSLSVTILLIVLASLLWQPLSTAVTAQTATPIYKDPNAAIPDRVADLLARMTLDEKIGQMTQVDRGSLTTESDIATYYLGSLLSGGGSAPTPNTPAAWADMYDRYQAVALSTRLGIPIIYGIDAVHGHNNVYGATIFPHNVGLGATRNPALIQAIGRATAEEVAGTGIDWTFAPCLCVARNERWGRTYESYGEDPEIARVMSTIVSGLQGTSLNHPASILATAKHWVGDGGTTGGDDQGDTQISEAELRRLHIPPYIDAIQKGVGSVMISYSSWNGQKLHGHRYLITDVLKGELGFTGLVVSDWAGIDQVPGDYASDVRTAINAGIDMVMVPHDYKLFTGTLRNEINAGTIPLARIDDAVRRILTKKFELGLFERPYTDRSYTATIGSAAHRALGRDAVRQSLVLLKNTNTILPLSKTAKIFVAGKNANDIGNQSGGWTISWQGSSGNITPGTTILQGIRDAVAPGTSVTYDKAGRGAAGHDVAVVVLGEKPYAEGQGDKPSYLGLDQEDKNTLNNVKRAGIPVIVVLVSGRPMIVSTELPNWHALIAAWLPGTEGQGVADVLFGDYKPTGKLPHSWPRSETQIPINVGDASYDPLFPYGFGLTYP
jgi:beta-glucosidase